MGHGWRKRGCARLCAAALMGVLAAGGGQTAFAAEADTMREADAKDGAGTDAGKETAAGAQNGIDMTTDYPGITVKAGESVSFGLDFASLSGDSYDASLSIESIPEGWEGYFKSSSSEISMVHVDAESEFADSALATFSLTLPDEVEEGTYNVTLKADAGSGTSDTLQLEINVTETENGQSSLTSEYPEQQGASGTSFSFDVTLVNNRGTEQTYSLAAEAESGWQVSFTPSGESTQVASITVEPGSSQGLTVDGTPPETIKEGEYTIPCTAISANETLSAELKVTITGSYEVQLSTPTGNLSLDAYANQEKAVTLSVINNGNVDLSNLNLTSSAPTDWEVRFDESTIELLEAGGTKEVTAYVKPSSDAITGDYVTSITVSNDETTSTAEFRISVKTQTLWGIVAVAIIIALLAGLGFLFKKYGRR